MITSAENSKIKDVCRLMAKKKERHSRGLFVAEGERLVFEVPCERIVNIFCTDDFAKMRPDMIIPDKTQIVSDKVFAKMSDTETPQGVLAVIRMPADVSLDMLLKGSDKSNSPLIIFAEDIRDPGNLGTIVRSAEAAGASGIVVNDKSVDIYSPKTVRATMGSIYRMPVFLAKDFHEELMAAKKRGIRLYAAYLGSSISYYEADFTVPCGILIGNEAAGLSKTAAKLADERIIIPMSGEVESLNAAMAASIIAFEAQRQRKCRKI